MSGSYQANDFQIMFPHYDAMSVLQLLETMKICVQVGWSVINFNEILQLLLQLSYFPLLSFNFKSIILV